MTLSNLQLLPTTARNISSTFDHHLNLNQHVNNVLNQAFFHFRNFGSNRKYISQQACEQLVHALIASRNDYGNILMFDLPSIQL
jgi:hypothetical protein